jgi:hypothetical protein
MLLLQTRNAMLLLLACEHSIPQKTPTSNPFFQSQNRGEADFPHFSF